MDFSNMEVTIDHIADAGAKIKAYATVTFDGMFKVHGVRLAESKQGLNIFMPQKAFNKNGKTLYTDVFIPSRPERARRSRKQSSTLTEKRRNKKREVSNEISRSLSASALKVGAFFMGGQLRLAGRRLDLMTKHPSYRARDQPQSSSASQFRKENVMHKFENRTQSPEHSSSSPLSASPPRSRSAFLLPSV